MIDHFLFRVVPIPTQSDRPITLPARFHGGSQKRHTKSIRQSMAPNKVLNDWRNEAVLVGRNLCGFLGGPSGHEREKEVRGVSEGQQYGRQPVTPQFILTNMLLKASEIEHLVICTKTRDNLLHAYWSDMSSELAIGLFEIGKMSVYNEILKHHVDVEGEG